MIFMKECPSCQKMFKTVRKCNHCKKYCCIECSINELCVNCYTKLHEDTEYFCYMDDKFKLRKKAQGFGFTAVILSWATGLLILATILVSVVPTFLDALLGFNTVVNFSFAEFFGVNGVMMLLAGAFVVIVFINHLRSVGFWNNR